MNTITEDMPVKFIVQKIQQIKSALFFSQNNDLVKMPTGIITVLKVDEHGSLWFFVKRPSQSMEAFEKEFPVRLDFFRKRVNYFLQVTGTAFIVEDTDVFMDDWGDIAPVYKENILRQLVLVRVKMMRVEYYDNPTADNKFWWNNFAEKIQQWFYHTWQWGKPYEIKPKHIAASIYA